MHPSFRRVVVVGASAGGVEAVSAMLRQLPSSFRAPIVVVIHIPSDAPSRLAAVFGRAGPLPAVQATDGTVIEEATVYVAPPDRHLLLTPEGLRTERGPRENGHRPAVDPLFRSAARTYGPRAVGVVLSGSLDDGMAGLAAIRSSGGVTIVQDPEEAKFSGMPRNAQRHADHVLPVRQITPLLEELTRLEPGVR